MNKSANRRAALIMDSRMHFMRQQEVFLLSLAPDVIQKLSPKSLARLGFRPTGMGGAEGTFRDTWQTTFRLAIADGTYTPIRQLSPESPASELAKDYTFRYSENGAFLSAHQANAADEVKQRYGKKTTARNVPGKLEGVQAVPGVGMQKL